MQYNLLFRCASKCPRQRGAYAYMYIYEVCVEVYKAVRFRFIRAIKRTLFVAVITGT